MLLRFKLILFIKVNCKIGNCLLIRHLMDTLLLSSEEGRESCEKLSVAATSDET